MSPEASVSNGFLIPGRECECDVDARCGNHDDAAEHAYWFAQWKGREREIAVADIALAYDLHDPKRYALVEEAA